jgi:hypothetical protein
MNDYAVREENNYIESIYGEKISKCRVNIEDSGKTWVISSWFTKEGYGGKGIGRKNLQLCLERLYEKYGRPENTQYIWNGTNSYVFDWLVEHFDAVCKCPIAVQKYQADDDWSSHIYELNIDKVFAYFSIGKI